MQSSAHPPAHWGIAFFIHLYQSQAKYGDLNRLVHEPLKTDNAGKWRSKMTLFQIKAFESVAGKTLRAFGHDLITPAKPPSPVIKAAYRLHNKLLTVFRWRAKKWLT